MSNSSMTRKRMQSLPPARLAALQCLVLSLLVSTFHHACAWIPSSATKRRRVGWNSNNAVGSSRKPTSLAGGGVLDFVKGLDSALGNPTAYSAAEETYKSSQITTSSVTAVQSSGGAVNMNIPNSVVLAGGGVAFLAFFGLALYFLTQNQGDNDEEASRLNTSFGIEDVAPLPKISSDDNFISQQLEAAETKFQDQNQQQEQLWQNQQQPVTVAEPSAIVTDLEDDSSGTLLAKLKAKLVRRTEELEENKELLASETEIRIDTESKLTAANNQNERLTEELANNEQALMETTEKWNYTKTKLQDETKLKETLDAELKVAAESNRLLEDMYELEQNALSKTKKDLYETESTLEISGNRLTRNQAELVRVHTELLTTKKSLSETNEDLESLEEERRSLRRLGKNMWRLSKSRVSNRIRSVGDKLRGRALTKNRKKSNKN